MYWPIFVLLVSVVRATSLGCIDIKTIYNSQNCCDNNAFTCVHMLPNCAEGQILISDDKDGWKCANCSSSENLMDTTAFLKIKQEALRYYYSKSGTDGRGKFPNQTSFRDDVQLQPVDWLDTNENFEYNVTGGSGQGRSHQAPTMCVGKVSFPDTRICFAPSWADTPTVQFMYTNGNVIPVLEEQKAEQTMKNIQTLLLAAKRHYCRQTELVRTFPGVYTAVASDNTFGDLKALPELLDSFDGATWYALLGQRTLQSPYEEGEYGYIVREGELFPTIFIVDVESPSDFYDHWTPIQEDCESENW